jgi:uncharacterized SAM-binding protein YcdF (DUF218 family)
LDVFGFPVGSFESRRNIAMFFVGKILQAFTLPPGIFVIGFAVLGIVSARARRRGMTIVSACAAVLLYAFSIGPIASLLSIGLEYRWPPLGSAGSVLGRGATEIVALGGGVMPRSPEYDGKASLTGTSAIRAAAAFRIARETGLPLLFSGGNANRGLGDESEAEAARRFWIGLGADPSRIRIETESRDTYENAKLVAAMVGKGPVVVVTSASHMPRAVLAFNKAGVEVIPAPTDFRVNVDTSPFDAAFLEWLPKAEYLETTAWAMHEYVGLLYYTVK